MLMWDLTTEIPVCLCPYYALGEVNTRQDIHKLPIRSFSIPKIGILIFGILKNGTPTFGIPFSGTLYSANFRGILHDVPQNLFTFVCGCINTFQVFRKQ